MMMMMVVMVMVMMLVMMMMVMITITTKILPLLLQIIKYFFKNATNLVIMINHNPPYQSQLTLINHDQR